MKGGKEQLGTAREELRVERASKDEARKVLLCSGALYYTHVASFSHLTWKLISTERYQIIFRDQGQALRPMLIVRCFGDP